MSAPAGRATAERDTLLGFLDDQRAALIARLDGLTEQQARMTPTVSSLSLLGLVKHSAVWERRWFQVIVAGRSSPDEWPERSDRETGRDDPTFVVDDHETIESVVAEYRRAIAASNEIVMTHDLDATCVRADLVDETVRWVTVHLIEETARHAGHADIIRESIDGARGR